MQRRSFLLTLAASMIVQARRDHPAELPFWAVARSYVPGGPDDVHRMPLVLSVKLLIDGQWVKLEPAAAEEWFNVPDDEEPKA